MMNFASLFNQFRSQNNSGVNDLLEQPNIRIGRLLDEDSFLNEYKSNNPKIIQLYASFYSSMKYDRYLELVQFLTVVGNPDDKKRAYKYPLSACDLLCIDNPTAVEFFLPEKPIITDLITTQEVEVDVEIQIQQLVPAPISNVQETASNEAQTPAKVNNNQQVAPQPEQKEVIAQNSQNIELKQQKPNSEDSSEQVNTAEATKIEKPQEEGTKQAEMIKVIKKITKKQLKQVDRIQKKEMPPLIIKLLEYFDDEVNYTLAGYISRILTFFYGKKPAELLKYLFESTMQEKILNHAESRSVGDLLVKILTTQSLLQLEKRGEVFKAMLARLSEPKDITIMSNLSAYVCEVIEKIAANLKGNNKIPEFNNVFFSLDVITSVITNVMSDEQNVSVYNAPILLTYLTNVPFVLPEDQDIVSSFKQLLNTFILKSCEKLQVDARSNPKVGLGRMKIVQILRFILKEDILNVKDIVSKKQDFFSILFKLLVQYEMNNLLHNQIVKIVDIALQQPEGSSFSNALLKDTVLLDLVVKEAQDDKKIRTGNSVYKSRKGYIAHIINLCIKLKELSDKSNSVKSITENEQFLKIYDTFVQKEIYNTKKSLAGYSMRKDLKHEIKFQKEDIIETYLTFLQKCPSPIFEQQPQHINIQHPDLVEELQKQLEDLTVKTNDNTKQLAQAQESKQEASELLVNEQACIAESVDPSNFWVVHLNYDVDDLLADL